MSSKFRFVISVLLAASIALSPLSFAVASVEVPGEKLPLSPAEYSGLGFTATAQICDEFGICWNPGYINPKLFSWNEGGITRGFTLKIQLVPDQEVPYLKVVVPYHQDLYVSATNSFGLMGTTFVDPMLREVSFEGAIDPAAIGGEPALLSIRFSAMTQDSYEGREYEFYASVTEITDAETRTGIIGPVKAILIAPLDDWSITLIVDDPIITEPGESIQYWIEIENLGDTRTDLSFQVSTDEGGVVDNLGGYPFIICTKWGTKAFTSTDNRVAEWRSSGEDTTIAPGETARCSINEVRFASGISSVVVFEGYHQDRDLSNNTAVHFVTLMTETPPVTTAPATDEPTNTPEPPTDTPEPTDSPEPTDEPTPTKTPVPPTDTPKVQNLYLPVALR
jgi:hypothetical protein